MRDGWEEAREREKCGLPGGYDSSPFVCSLCVQVVIRQE